MGQVREVEITEADVTNAIIETEKEIAGGAWGDEETEAFDPTGDRSLEEMGEGLEGQHEAGDELETEDVEGEGEGDDADGEGEGGTVAGKVEPEPVAAKPGTEQQQPKGLVPSVKLREATERARAAEAERDRLRQEAEARAQDPALAALKAQVDTLTQLLQGRQPLPQQQQVEPERVPDIFEDPTGYAEYLQRGFRAELSKRDEQIANTRLETSMAIAHTVHKDKFEQAFAAVGQLDPRNPDDRATVQRIYHSPNPGEALVAWHKRNETMRRVGSDPEAFEERIRAETRQALMSDPKFREELIASLRQDAQAGDNGSPRTTTRLPRSLARAAGSNVGARIPQGAADDSDQAVAASAWADN